MVHKPFGLFMALAWSRRTSQRMKIALITLGGLVLSLCMENLQSYLPARVSTLSDTLFNAVGSCSGAVLCHTLAAHLHRHTQTTPATAPLHGRCAGRSRPDRHGSVDPLATGATKPDARPWHARRRHPPD